MLPSIQVMRRAFARKDAQFDGVFYVGVKTTGVFCRPVCKAKPALPRNLEFFASAIEASNKGYRPCKLCKPQERAGPPPLVERLMETLKQNPEMRFTARRLQEMRIDPSTARRQFQRYCGMSFAAYQRSLRLGSAIADVRRGRKVVEAQVGAGYESSSGFRAAFARHFGAAPEEATQVKHLQMKWLSTPLGQMLAVAGDEGIVLCDFFDRRDIEDAVAHVRERFGNRATPALIPPGGTQLLQASKRGEATKQGTTLYLPKADIRTKRDSPLYLKGAVPFSSRKAVIAPGENRHLDRLEAEMSLYFAGKLREFSVALSPVGTDFELKAWDFLRSIPYGETRSYGQQAKAIGLPHASRAVGRANGMNFIAIVIPCHRVIGANGKLTGYGGGLARKQWLLEHERFSTFSSRGKSMG
jgi:AraC family transcriptional regulator of adaptative response/methylated-DNA-[protein]-cysteine methyltransferase